MSTDDTRAPSREPAAPIETDAVIVGAGPVGLFQVFELTQTALLLASCSVIERTGATS